MQRSVSTALVALCVSALIWSDPSSAQPAPPAPGSGGASAPPAAPAPSAAPAPDGSAPAAGQGSPESKKPAAGTTGGYSWTDKPRPRQKRARVRVDPNAPLASYPGFRMLADGSSKVWVSVTRPVDVQVRRTQGHFTLVLSGVNVGVRNNTNPLVTTHFDTPLERARLVQDRAGALLVLDLREAVEPTHKLSKGPYGTTVLEIALPRAQRRYSDRAVPMPARGSRPLPGAAAPAAGGTAGTRGPSP